MKKIIKWIFIVILLIIFAVDIYGIWKFKISGTQYELASTEPAQSESQDLEPEEEPEENVDVDNGIEYAQLSSEDFWQNEKLFITNIEIAPGQNLYKIDGLIYKEYTIASDVYRSLSNGGTINLFGVDYKKDYSQSYNFLLKAANDEDKQIAESFYIKYDATTQKYVLKDATTDYSVYQPTEKYVTTTVNSSLPFEVKKNNKTDKLTVADVADTHNHIEVPGEKIKISYSTIEFSKKGSIIKITELNV